MLDNGLSVCLGSGQCQSDEEVDCVGKYGNVAWLPFEILGTTFAKHTHELRPARKVPQAFSAGNVRLAGLGVASGRPAGPVGRRILGLWA